MNKNRRRFVQASLLGGAAVAAGGLSQTATAREKKKKVRANMNILILGGTGFIGPHMVREALRRGHQVSLFNRGKTNNAMFPDLKLYVGDRDGGLDVLKGNTWDAVIDNSGYIPRLVADSARRLKLATSHYLYTSTISVYASFAIPNNENSPLGKLDDESVEEVTGATYGPLKALCEKRAAAEIAADRLTILRPTYICGPGDTTDRFTYWPVRTMRGGDMLWPGTRADKTQIIDVRDYANFTIDCLERRITGTFNTVTPAGAYTMGDLHDDCLAVTASDMTAVWVGKELIRDQKLADGGSIPIWAPPDGEYAGIAFVSGEKAVAQGLKNRPIRETARGIIRWWQTLPEERTSKLRAGLDPDQEAQILALWLAQNS
jgi:nucleoside-diphosphate-sugar epimerase